MKRRDNLVVSDSLYCQCSLAVSDPRESMVNVETEVFEGGLKSCLTLFILHGLSLSLTHERAFDLKIRSFFVARVVPVSLFLMLFRSV